MKVIALNDMVHPGVGDICMDVPTELEGLPTERLRFVNGQLIDAANLSVFYVDQLVPIKHATPADGRQQLACSWDDELVRDGDFWRLRASSDALSEAKAQRILMLTRACGAAIIGGYRSAALGADHLYPSTPTDQINMMGSVTASLLPELPVDWTTPFWVRDVAGEWSWQMHDASQIRQAGRDGKAHIVECQTTLAMLSASAKNATSSDEIDAIVWPTAG